MGTNYIDQFIDHFKLIAKRHKTISCIMPWAWWQLRSHYDNHIDKASLTELKRTYRSTTLKTEGRKKCLGKYKELFPNTEDKEAEARVDELILKLDLKKNRAKRIREGNSTLCAALRL